MPSSCLLVAALLEKKTDLDKRGMGMSDYSNGMNKPLVCRPSALSKDPSERTTFLDKVGRAQVYGGTVPLTVTLGFTLIIYLKLNGNASH